MTLWMDALDKLKSFGYSFTLKDQRLIYAYEGKGNPSQYEITPLLEALKTHKAEILKDPCFLIEQTLQEIGKDYRPGLVRWMRRESGQWSRFLTLEDEINAATFVADEQRLKDALSRYQGFFDEMLNVFEKGEAFPLFSKQS